MPEGYSLSAAKKSGTTTMLTNKYSKESNPPDEPDPPKPVYEKINIPVIKYWNDANNSGNTRPAQIVVALAADGKLTGQTLVLNAANNWQGVFYDLPKWEAGNRIQYTVLEDAVPGYVPAITGDKDSGFTIVNSLTAAPTAARATGDDSHMVLFGVLMALAILALAGFGIYTWKKEH